MTFVETSTVELKRTFMPSLKKEIVAFANTDGGTVYLGVEDDGTVIGVEDPRGVADAVNNMIHDAVVPDLSMFAEAHVERFDDVQLVVVTVHRGPDRPYCIAGKGLRPEGVYVRQGTSSQPLTFDGIKRLLREEAGDSFEEGRSLDQELTFDESSSILSERGIAFGDAQRQTLGVANGDGLFSNLGYMLSDQCARGIKIARFTGNAKMVFQTRRDLDGSVVRQVVDALEMLDMLNNVHAEVGARPERVEWRDYPPEALREALVNAVVHRDYRIRADIGINLFDDRCEIVSPGGLPDGATTMAALAGISVARNPRLAALFYRLRWVEAYGTGLMKMRDAYGGTGLEPEIDFLDGAVRVILPNAGVRLSPSAEGVGNEAGKPGADGESVLMTLSGRAWMTKRGVAAATGFSATKAARLLRELVDDGLVEAEGATKARVYRRI